MSFMEITVCPPGKRSKHVVERARPESSIPLTTATSLTMPAKASILPPARPGDRRTAQERVEAAQRAEALSVALAQPHRAGSDDPRKAFPLGRFVERTWPRDGAWRDKMHAAGVAYAADVRAFKVARGFHVVGAEREVRKPEGTDDASLDEIEAQRATIDGLQRALDKANALLRGVMPRLPGVMERLCFDLLDPSPYDEAILASGLYRLAMHYGVLDRAFSVA